MTAHGLLTRLGGAVLDYHYLKIPAGLGLEALHEVADFVYAVIDRHYD
jgi:hypothetical protein